MFDNSRAYGFGIAVYGAVLSLLTMSGAIVGYLTKLGIALPAVGDNGELFALAVIVFVSCAAILVLHRTEIPLPASRRHA